MYSDLSSFQYAVMQKKIYSLSRTTLPHPFYMITAAPLGHQISNYAVDPSSFSALLDSTIIRQTKEHLFNDIQQILFATEFE